jgi:GAF domain-containing protein/DNA-binding response OmpR family regulator
VSDGDAALLVVDDIDDNRFALSRRLARQGYLNVTTAADGRQALELLNSKSFDLVLLDIMMPTVNGYEVLAQMKASSSLRHIPVIMISAVDEIESVIRCIELGAEDYLPKPFNPTLLRARVGACLERKRLHDQVTARTRELSEALEQQTATSEVLKIISSSPGELERVFEAMLANATRICQAAFGSMLLGDGDPFRRVALHNAPEKFAKFSERAPLMRSTDVPSLDRLVRTKQVVQVVDLAAEGPDEPIAKFAGARTLLIVPMLKETELIGAMGIYRQEVRPFTEKQIELVQNFASQAVIAIENTRLLRELRQRTDDLTESLEQQTAMSEVLRLISSSPTDLAPVFDTILTNATRLCEGNFGALWQYDGEALVGAAQYNVSPGFAELCRNTKLRLGREGAVRKAALERRTVQVADITVEPGFSPVVLQYENARTVLAVPLLREKDLVGVVGIWRREVEPFTEQQIALVRTFADQAAIAIENARLLNELRESLQQQTATADVLKVISRSTFDLQTVLHTLVKSAVRLCEADIGHIARPNKEGFFQSQANFGFSTELKDELERTPFEPGRGSVTGRALLERATVQVLDAQTDPEYKLSKAQKLGSYRTMIGAPLLREGIPIGVFGLARYSVRPFTDKQMELLTTFADQAVIAIENVRLFDEVQARTSELACSVEELRALGEVSQAVNSTLDLQTVLDTIVAKAAQLSGTEAGAIYVRDERQEFQLRATYGMSAELHLRETERRR